MNTHKPKSVVRMSEREKLSKLDDLPKALRERQVERQIVPSAMALLTSGVREKSAHESLQAEAFRAMLPTVDTYIENCGIEVDPASRLGSLIGDITVLEAEAAAHSAMAQALKQLNAGDWQSFIKHRSPSSN